MAATTTAFNSLLQKLKSEHSDVSFESSDDFRWSSSLSTVYYKPGKDVITLLHETAHAVLSHTSYEHDIGLIHLEREAWNKTLELGKQYGVAVDPEIVENALDTYRDWLHARSLCPLCKQNGVQTGENTYTCVICNQKWTVNDARSCGLKRHKIN